MEKKKLAIVVAGATTLVGIIDDDTGDNVVMRDSLSILTVNGPNGLGQMIGSCWLTHHPIDKIRVRYDCLMLVDDQQGGASIERAYEDRVSELAMARSGIVPGRIGDINEK